MAMVSSMQRSLPRTAAITVSLLLHALLFIGYGGSRAPVMEKPQEPSVTRLSFLAPAVKPQPVPEKIEEAEPEAEPEVKPEPVKKKVVKKLVKAAKPVKKQQPKPQPPKPVVQQQASAVAKAAPQIDEGVIARKRERYLAEVMAHIESHKWYPKAARRRGITGEVSVRFMLHADGTTRAVHVADGPSLLLSAAEQAVKKAVPMPKPPQGVDCPLECEFRMRFSLDAS